MGATHGPPRSAAWTKCERRVALVLFATSAFLLAAGLVAAWTHGERALDWLDRHTEITRSALRIALRDGHGLVFYAPFDESHPEDFLSGELLSGTGTVRVQGAVGTARRFDGRPGENLVVPCHFWNRFTRGGLSLSFWLRLPDELPPGESRILWDHDQSNRIGIRVIDGHLAAIFTDAAGAHSLSAPALKRGAFVHIAFALGTDRAALFVGGRECASCPVSAPLALPAHPVSIGTDIHYATAFAIDELGLWNRPLSDADAALLASTHRPLPVELEPQLAFRFRLREATSNAFRLVLSVLGSIGSSRSSSALFNREIPSLDLRFPGGARRHFHVAHLEALSSGGRTTRGAKPRRGQASLSRAMTSHAESAASAEGESPSEKPAVSEPVLAWLDDTAVTVRPAFVLAVEGNLFGEGSGVVRLFPPEQFGTRRPDAAFPLPLDPSRLVRLHLNGDFLGLYCLVPFEDSSPPWFATGPRDVSRPDRLHFSTPTPGAAAGAGMSEEERDAAWRRMLALLRTDPCFPLTPAEVRALANRHVENREALRLPAPGAGASEQSRAIHRPSGLPALFLSFGRPLDKLARTDFVCLRIPGGEDSEPEWLFGTGPGGGGVKLRGNTSYITGRRRAMNLKFDEGVSVPGAASPVRHLLLLSGYADPTRLRNALAFDIFRLMAPDGVSRASPVSWVDVYVNGAYAGVWECCPRLQDALSEPFTDLFKVRSPHGLWIDPDATAESVDRVDRTEAADPYESIRELARFVSATKPAAFAAEAPEVFDIDELIDFWLLLNFTGNADGLVTNQFIGRRASDGRWLLLPWDYDKTFRPVHGKPLQKRDMQEVLTNPVFRKLFSGNRTFRTRLAARWRDLRAGLLSDAALDAWIDEHAALLAPRMDEDYRVVPPLGHDGDFAEAIDALRAEVHVRAAWLDGLFRQKSAP